MLRVSRRVLLGAGASIAVACNTGPKPAVEARFPADDMVRDILKDRIDVQQRSVGIAVGLIEPAGRRVITWGQTGGAGSKSITPDTVFEIASTSKVFTAFALAESVERGEVQLADPVARYLPDMPPLKRPDGADITLLDLATHASGLPMWAPGASPTTDFPRLAGYSADDLYAWLRTYAPAPETRPWAYSNVGAGLLGLALARLAGTTYGQLIEARIAAPLGMTRTDVAPPLNGQPRARGHFPDLRPAPDWIMPSLEGAASIHSTADDMLRFLAGFLGYRHTRLDAAMRAMRDVRRPGPEPGLTQALGWLIAGEGEYVQFAGATAGFAAFMSFRPSTLQGIVVLSNSAEPVGDLANHLIRVNSPLSRPRGRFSIPPERLDRYPGVYVAEEGGAYSVTRDGDRLMLRPPNLQMTFAMVAQSEEAFYVPQLGLSVSFTFDADGRASDLSARQGTETPKRAKRKGP